jgi:hypothetical protein
VAAQRSVVPPVGKWRQFLRWVRRGDPRGDGDGDGDAGGGLLGARRRFFPSELERYQAREEAQWRMEPAEIQSLAWLLRMKHEEARVRGRTERSMGFVLSTLAAAAALGATYITFTGWTAVLTKGLEAGVIPPGLWELAIATSAAVLLIGGIATGLFKAAQSYYARARAHDAEMEWTRKVETAVRLSLAAKCDGLAPEAREALKDLGLELLGYQAPADGAFPAPSLTPELLAAAFDKGVEQLAAVLNLIKGAKGGG